MLEIKFGYVILMLKVSYVSWKIFDLVCNKFLNFQFRILHSVTSVKTKAK